MEPINGAAMTTTVIVLCAAKKTKKVRSLIEHWFEEEDVTLAGQGSTDKQDQGAIILEFDAGVPGFFIENLDAEELVTDYLLYEHAEEG